MKEWCKWELLREGGYAGPLLTPGVCSFEHSFDGSATAGTPAEAPGDVVFAAFFPYVLAEKRAYVTHDDDRLVRRQMPLDLACIYVPVRIQARVYESDLDLIIVSGNPAAYGFVGLCLSFVAADEEHTHSSALGHSGLIVSQRAGNGFVAFLQVLQLFKVGRTEPIPADGAEHPLRLVECGLITLPRLGREAMEERHELPERLLILAPDFIATGTRDRSIFLIPGGFITSGLSKQFHESFDSNSPGGEHFEFVKDTAGGLDIRGLQVATEGVTKIRRRAFSALVLSMRPFV